MKKVIRYVAREPDKLNGADKFDGKFDDHYQQQLSLHRLDYYFVDEKKHQFFLISRVAPSIVEKRVATGGRFILNTAGELTDYEEIFRTWKMVPDTLKRRSYLLFDKMVKGESLERYYTKYSKGVDYIEFPDDFVYFDKETRSWKIK